MSLSLDKGLEGSTGKGKKHPTEARCGPHSVRARMGAPDAGPLSNLVSNSFFHVLHRAFWHVKDQSVVQCTALLSQRTQPTENKHPQHACSTSQANGPIPWPHSFLGIGVLRWLACPALPSDGT
jgi:hypothetical protein